MAELNGDERIHIVGAGGAGMSALAKLLWSRGHRVTGSDARWGPALATLADLGLDVWAGHRPEAIDGADLVVASSAVPDSDIEITSAVARGIDVWRRPDLLDAITAGIPTLGATGTHGKTSSTGMLVSAVRAAGVDASFVLGGELVEFGTNAALGSDPLLVLEADEAFRTFERVHLTGLMVTNVEAEHVEHFGSVEALEDAFVEVVRAVDGPVVVCLDDPGGSDLAERSGAPGYGLRPGAAWRMSDVSEVRGSIRFRLTGPHASCGVVVPRVGLHMARNAAGVLALCAEHGLDLEAAAVGVAAYRGVRRRFEHRGTVSGVRLVDDYAHHPTEVAATLREALGSGNTRVVAVFQPHLYSRTERFQGEFGTALAQADVVIVSDVYGAREAPRPGVTGALVADAAVRAAAPDVRYVPHLADLAGAVAEVARSGDLVLTMGAGDITVVATEILAALERRL
jgi:UDP-N-acetylmuramate--alanine ligase